MQKKVFNVFLSALLTISSVAGGQIGFFSDLTTSVFAEEDSFWSFAV
ncbi:MAG: hypothetical protein V3G42_13175 [Oscillospiraceae bacterium]